MVSLETQSAPIDTLLHAARTTPQRKALVAGDAVWSYADLARDSQRVATALRRRGVGRGDRVAVHMCNRPEVVLLYIACLRLGAIAVPLNTRSAHAELLDVVTRTRPSLYVGERDGQQQFARVPDSILANQSRILVDAADDTVSGLVELLAGVDLTSVGPTSETDANLDPDAPALLLSTSGTSGRSKLVVWSHRTLSWLDLSAAGRGAGPDAVVPLLTSLMHAAGVYFTFAALLSGGAIVLLPDFEAADVLDTIERHRATTVFGMPFMYTELVAEQRNRLRDVSSVRSATVAGDVCPAEVETAFQQVFGLELCSFWAATEDVGATVAADRAGPFFRAVTQARIRVVDGDDCAVDYGDVGEMILSSPTTAPGYWEGRDAVTPMPGDTFRSGDLVQQIGRDVFRYVGRAKDLIVRGGSNISPTEVEDVLRAHPDIVDAGVAGFPDPRLGQRVGALVVLADDATDDSLEKMIVWARTQLADHKVPDRIVHVSAVPRNALTKIDRQALVTHLCPTGAGRLDVADQHC